MMYKLGWVNWARLIIWLAVGMVVYFTYSAKHSRVRAGVAHSRENSIKIPSSGRVG